eukprot:1394243-Amorphochlora_amoeboformis.AAC.2
MALEMRMIELFIGHFPNLRDVGKRRRSTKEKYSTLFQEKYGANYYPFYLRSAPMSSHAYTSGNAPEPRSAR